MTGFDYLIVGCGFAGAVLAERLAEGSGKRVLVVDKRMHIGGNAYDHYDEAGVLVHKYGPHIFHTNSREVYDYLSGFTEWRPYQHRVRAWVDGQLVPMPINLDTVNTLYGLNLTSFQVEEFFASMAEPCAEVMAAFTSTLSFVNSSMVAPSNGCWFSFTTLMENLATSSSAFCPKPGFTINIVRNRKIFCIVYFKQTQCSSNGLCVNFLFVQRLISRISKCTLHAG